MLLFLIDTHAQVHCKPSRFQEEARGTSKISMLSTQQSSSGIHQKGVRKFAPAKYALFPSSSSMRSNWLYLARRSLRQGAPVLIRPVLRPTTRSAMKESSVSPDRWDTITPQPFFIDIIAE